MKSYQKTTETQLPKEVKNKQQAVEFVSAELYKKSPDIIQIVEVVHHYSLKESDLI